MSEDCNGNEADTSRCASCGVAGTDEEVKLKDCSACHLVKYCGVECQKGHRKQHKKECKKRAAELRDELLFKQPESSCFGDCPICCLPMLDEEKSSLEVCCSKMICNGCVVANMIREEKGRLQQKCLFCRKPTPKTREEIDKRNMKRVEANDPVAIYREGTVQSNKGNHKRAFEFYARAAALGRFEAHAKLAYMYRFGRGIESDEGKSIHHLEEASIGGHPRARNMLGNYEYMNGNIERAVKHWIIAATQGEEMSMQYLLDAFKSGSVEKDVLAATIRAHKAAVDAMKSPQREEAKKKKYRVHW